MHRGTLSAAPFFAVLLAGVFGVLLHTPQSVSATERRALRQFPVPDASAVLSGAWANRLEAWLPDQFPAREPLRQLAMRMRTRTLGLLDYRGVYVSGGQAAEALYPSNERNVQKLAARIDALASTLLSDKRVYCALIPDKSMLLPKEHGRPVASFAAMERAFAGALDAATRLPVGDLLTAEDYYATDTHWRQERLLPVAARLANGMGAPLAETSYTVRAFAPFYGGYFARQAAWLPPDTLLWLESDLTRAATARHARSAEVSAMYNLSALSGMDAYDVFLSGPSPLVTVVSAAPPPAAKGRTLLLFRDSFGSSLAPLLLPAYETIVLIDLRYLDASLLPAVLPTGEADVLFLYSAAVANAGSMLR